MWFVFLLQPLSLPLSGTNSPKHGAYNKIKLFPYFCNQPTYHIHLNI